MIKLSLALCAITLVWIVDITIYEFIIMKRRNKELRRNRMNKEPFTYNDVPIWVKWLLAITQIVALGLCLGEIIIRIVWRGL